MTSNGRHSPGGLPGGGGGLDIYDQVIAGLPPFVLDQRAWAELLPAEREIQPAPVLTLPSAEGRFVLDSNDPRNRKVLDAEFKSTAKGCKRSLSQLGLHREFGRVLGSMLQETRMVVTDPPTDETDTGESEFYIVRDAETGQTERLLLLHPDEVKRDVGRLQAAFRALPFLEAPSTSLPVVSLEWIIGRKIMDLAGTACYMRQEYGQFMPGFGGYTPLYMARRTIALSHLATHTLSPEAFNDPDVETIRGINGFGLHWLEKTLIRRNLVVSDEEANFVLRAILKEDRKKLANSTDITDRLIGAAAPLNTEELIERLGGIFPSVQPAYSCEVMNELASAIR